MFDRKDALLFAIVLILFGQYQELAGYTGEAYAVGGLVVVVFTGLVVAVPDSAETTPTSGESDDGEPAGESGDPDAMNDSPTDAGDQRE